MNILIAGVAFTATRPDDLDKRVIAATGCSVAELEASLASGPVPSLIAELLHPCLSGADVPSKAKLAALLATALAENARETIATVRKAIAAVPKRSAD